MDTEEPKSHIQETSVCVRMCVCACICAKGKKTNDGEYQYFRDKFPRQWRSSEQSRDISAAVQIRFLHAGLEPLKRISS